MVPIRKLDTIGAIGNYWVVCAAALRAGGLTLMQALDDATSIAMENVQVYSELEQRVHDRTVALERANEEIRQSTGLLTDRTGQRIKLCLVDPAGSTEGPGASNPRASCRPSSLAGTASTTAGLTTIT